MNQCLSSTWSCRLCQWLVFTSCWCFLIRCFSTTGWSSWWQAGRGSRDDDEASREERRAVEARVTLNTQLQLVIDWHGTWTASLQLLSHGTHQLWLVHRAVSLFHWPLQLPSFHLNFFFHSNCFGSRSRGIYFSLQQEISGLIGIFILRLLSPSLVRVSVEPWSFSSSISFLSSFFLSREVLVTVHCGWSLNPSNPAVFSFDLRGRSLDRERDEGEECDERLEETQMQVKALVVSVSLSFIPWVRAVDREPLSTGHLVLVRFSSHCITITNLTRGKGRTFWQIILYGTHTR